MTKPAPKRAEELQYSLRSSFFYRRREEFKEWLRELRAASSSRYDWSELDKLGISEAAWHRSETNGLNPVHVFCHPHVIRRKPRLVGYYRSIAALSQKGVQRLAFGTRQLEEGTARALSAERAVALAKLFNSHMSAVIESELDFSLEDVHLVGMMNFGTQINGSWRNEIGAEGALRVKRLLLGFLAQGGFLAEIASKARERLSWPLDESQLADVQQVSLTNSYRIVFGSEPDVCLLDEAGTLHAAIEVKAGKDPAGALERYGAAKKSFDRALKLNKSAATVYLADCLTRTVKRAIQADRLVTREFDLTQVLLDKKERANFLEHVKWLLHL